jgi:hypothetical protein
LATLDERSLLLNFDCGYRAQQNSAAASTTIVSVTVADHDGNAGQTAGDGVWRSGIRGWNDVQAARSWHINNLLLAGLLDKRLHTKYRGSAAGGKAERLAGAG